MQGLLARWRTRYLHNASDSVAVARLERLRVFALDRGGLLALATAILYMWLAPPHIVDGDNAEFATVGTIGGTAHPSGYPLYLLWLRAMQWLPGTTPAHTTALATALIGAASILVLHAACRAWGARPLAATIAVAIFAGAPVAMRTGSRAEVFALNDLMVASVLWLAANGGPLRGGWRVVALGFVAGLGISNHMTCTLVTPVGLLGVVRGAREARISWRALGLALAGFLVGMLPYVYLFITPNTALSWGTVRSLDDLIGMITRRDYGGPGAFLPGGKDVAASTQLAALAMTLGRTWLWVPLAVGLVALGQRSIRRYPGETRWGWALLAASWLAAGPLLATRFNIEPVGLGLYVCERFHVLPAMLLAVPIAAGLTSFGSFATRTKVPERVACGIVATVGVFSIAGLSLPHLLRVHTPAVEQYARNVLESLPPNAVLFAGQDGEYFGMGYMQAVLHVRPDVTVIAWQLTNFPWYAERMTRKGIYAPEGSDPAIVRVVDYLLAVDRPVFTEVTKTTAPVVKTHPNYPFGPVIRVLPRDTKPPPIDEVVALNEAIYERFKLSYARPGTDDEFATAFHHRYAATWKMLARTLEGVGKHEEAARAAAIAREIGPQP